MRLVFGTLVSATALVFGLACGDDDGDTQNGDGDDHAHAGKGGQSGQGGQGGGAGADNEEPNCLGVYAAWTASELESAASTGACEEDTAEVCARDLNFEVGLRGQACFGEHPDDPAALAECTLDAVKAGQASNPSDACLGCYIASVACVQQFCLAECVSNPTSQECIDCRAEQGCTGAFYECSGLPLPQPAPNGD